MDGLIFCIQEVLSNTMCMYMCAYRLSDHTNADLCIDDKSGFSHDISFVHCIQLAAVQENFLLSGCINTGYVRKPHCSRVNLPKPDYQGSVHVSFSICLIPRKRRFCPDMTKIVDRDVKPKHNPLTEKKVLNQRKTEYEHIHH